MCFLESLKVFFLESLKANMFWLSKILLFNVVFMRQNISII